VALATNVSIQAEYRHNETRNGDVDLRFDPNNFSPTLRNEQETEAYRLGFHYAISPRSDIIASALYQDADQVLDDPPSLITIKSEAKAYGAEAQHLFHTEQLSIIVGVGKFKGKYTAEGTLFGFPFTDDFDVRHTNFYVYSPIILPFNATLTIGGSGDFFEGPPRDQDQLNPKLGLTWNPTPATTIRLAGFRVLKRPLISQQTIEPTQVAGFQQFFDDPDGTDSKRYGIGIDHKVTSDLFGGVELSRRDVVVPGIAATPGAPSELDIDERLKRAYVYWTPLTWLAAKAEYQLEWSDASDITLEPGARITTHRVPLGLNFFHPAGFFLKLKGTYVNQKGVFLDTSTFTFEPGDDQLWLVDTALGYRLPRRMGILTIEAKNLLDESFRFQDVAFSNPSIQPGRVIFARLTLSL